MQLKLQNTQHSFYQCHMLLLDSEFRPQIQQQAQILTLISFTIFINFDLIKRHKGNVCIQSVNYPDAQNCPLMISCDIFWSVKILILLLLELLEFKDLRTFLLNIIVSNYKIHLFLHAIAYVYLKFIDSEKATKFCEIFIFLCSGSHK